MNTAIEKFAVFILTHGRPDKVVTYRQLRKQGYTGEVYFVVDNEDKTIDEYKKNYGDKVIVFDKLAISKTFDTGDNFNDRRAVIYARNACFGIARDLGISYFLELDDDYTSFAYRYDPKLKYKFQMVKNLDRLFEITLDYYKKIDALSIAYGQGGDFIGGKNSTTGGRLWLKRKCMNTFFCSAKRPFTFVGRINEDVNTYLSAGNRGGVMFTIFNADIIQLESQSNKGGMTEMYLDTGTYIKSFYSVMYCPSFVKIYEMGESHKRLHHKIDWSCAVPKILDPKHRVTEQ